MKRFEILPSPLEEGVRRTEGVILEKQRSRGQEGFSEGRKLGGQEDRLVNNDIPSPLEGEGCFQLEAESRKLENRVRGLSEEQRSRGQEDFSEGRKSGGQEDKPVNKTSPRPLREREEFVSERSELTNSGEGLKKCKLFNDSSLNDILLKPQNDTALSPHSPIAQSPLNNKKPDCLAHARNDVKNYIVKALSPYSPIAISPSNKKAAFTLAEVMIVVAIIGVVAMFVLPLLLTEVTERVDSNRQANIAQKITKAVELMIVGGDYEQFETTEQFADKFQKYLKITKRCNSDELTKCWPTSKVTVSDGSKYDVSKATTGKQLHTGTETNNVGFVLNDGASIILNYNPNASIPNADSGFKPTKKSLPVGEGKTKEFAYTSNATGAIDFVMDVNGGQGPNAEIDKDGKFHDVRSFKKASFSPINASSCKEYPNSIYLEDTATSFSICLVNLDTNYKCISEDPYNNYNNCWAGAKKACSDIGLSLADQTTLTNICRKFNNKAEGLSIKQWVWSSNTYNDELGSTMYFDYCTNFEGQTKQQKRIALCVTK